MDVGQDALGWVGNMDIPGQIIIDVLAEVEEETQY